MKRWIAIGLLLSLTVALFAADDKPKHNALTEKEAADGWLQLFDGETTFGWQSPNGSKWTIANGMLAPQADKPGLLVSTTAFADYEIQFDYIRRYLPQADPMKPPDKVEISFGCDAQGKPKYANRHELQFRGDGWTTMQIVVKDGVIQSVSGRGAGQFSGFAFKTASPKTDMKPTKHTGYIAFSGNGFVLRNIKLKPLGATAILLGKGLPGWKKYTGDPKREKTEFSLTQEGWLHLKDGPGDLQTEKQYDDFVLQMECRTNGKLLNSGVFFRCIPGQYQNGYEAQIQNGWTDKPEKEVSVDIYDPETNKLKSTEKVKTAAIDYGTGAIYRRIPARKQAAKDNEWFTMTVVAQGRHIATWVNGVQTVDWTDNRPLNENPRNGCRLEKGHLSLQGHDPTTDLVFRNFRIAELPAEQK